MSNVSQYCVFVEFELEAVDRESFIHRLLENRRDTLSTEHGCLSYEVYLPNEGDTSVVLFETYRDEEDYKVHHASAHWRRWNTTGAPLVKQRRVIKMQRRL